MKNNLIMRNFLCAAFLLLCQQAFSQAITAADSIFMFVDAAGEKIVLHPVKKGQTLYSLSKHYGVPVEELKTLNPSLANGTGLEPGQRISIPVPNAAIRRTQPKGPAGDFARLYYVVQPKETLYTIAKRHFGGMPLDSVLARNQIKGNAIEVGQKLFVGWFTTKPIDPKYRASQKAIANGAVPAAPHSTAARPVPAEKNGTISVRGMAQWDAKSGAKSTEMSCLHREASVESTVAVYYPQTKKRIYVKVKGPVAKTTNPNVDIVLTPAAAASLGIKDPKVPVDMEYIR